MGDKDDYLTSYRVFFENFAATVNPEDQLPVNIAGYTITEAELPGEVIYWTTQYLTEKQCPLTLMTPLRRIVLDEVRVASKKHPAEFGYKSDESVYIALRLMQAVTARVNNVCLRYLDNSKLDTLPPPPPIAQRDLKTVSCATKNGRRVMEDRHVEFGNLEALFGKETTEPTSFYAVYDGHAGSAAATYCAAHLHQYLIESPHFTTDLQRAMRDAFLRTDAEFIRKSNQERANGGSTAVAVCLRGSQLLAAWAGDSLALLAKRMRLMQLVRPHKPGRQDERDRIETSGGTVIYWGTWRVNGQLAVSRAIGDAQYKPYVTARPEIATVDLDGDEDFVVIACDGLWDFVTEDDVALSVYRQLAADPDDLKAVTKRLIIQAKKLGSADNISIIVVFLKDPRDIVADNYPPMDLGLDNTLANVTPFAVETESCRRQVDIASGGDADAEAETEPADNGVDNSDSDSEDLGPETAVDVDDIDAEKNPEPAPPTPPAHTVEEGHVDGALVDNVAESGEDSEDEWNYYKGEGEREEKNASEEPEEQPRSETPCQDNSGWESSSVDMNSSPLNPDAPVFVPGSAATDVLLAESPRKPLPMDDIDLPDVTQFRTEAVVRPAELLDLDNCDQLNGHHNATIEDTMKEQINGNDNCNMDSLGFGFNVGIEPDKVKDVELIQDFERIQKDTTDFCNIQVFQTHAEANPFALEENDELFERLKNKERDPMSMSFYQEKDDDTCERLTKNDLQVDLNAVQPLPDSDDEDLQQNGICENSEGDDKENVNPKLDADLTEADINSQEPNNDIMILNDKMGALSNNVCNFNEGDNFVDYNINSSDNLQSFSNIEYETTTQETVIQTDTPESHKLMFEQIPEIPDGKSSELGFTNDELQDCSDSEKDLRAITPLDKNKNNSENEIHDDEIQSEVAESFIKELEEDLEKEHEPEIIQDSSVDILQALRSSEVGDEKDEDFRYQVEEYKKVESDIENSLENNEKVLEVELTEQINNPNPEETSETKSVEDFNVAANAMVETEAITPEPTYDKENVVADIHTEEPQDIFPEISSKHTMPPEIRLYGQEFTLSENADSPVPSPQPVASPLPTQNQNFDELQNNRISSPAKEFELFANSPKPSETFTPKENLSARESPLPTESPLLTEPALSKESLLRSDSPLHIESPFHAESPLPAECPLSDEHDVPVESPLPTEETLLPSECLLPEESPLPSESPLPAENVTPETESTIQTDHPLPTVDDHPVSSPLPVATSLEPRETTTELDESVKVTKDSRSNSPLPAEVPLPRESPIPAESHIPVDDLITSIETPLESTIQEVASVEDQPEVEREKSDVSLEPVRTEVVEPMESTEPEDSLMSVSAEPLEMKDSLASVSPEPLEVKDPLATVIPEPLEEKESVTTEPLEVKDSQASVTAEPLEVKDPLASVTTELLEAKAPLTSESLEAVDPLDSVPAKPLEAIEISPLLNTELADSESSIAESVIQPSIEKSVPAPDVVPEERGELVTDIDIGIPERRAQEICVPVTNEIRPEEAEQPPAAATPPPTPAVDLSAALADTPLAADIAAPALAATAIAGAVTAAALVKTKTPTSTKKSPSTPATKTDVRTPKSAAKTATPRSAPPSAKKTETVTKATPTSARSAATRTTSSTTKTAPKASAAPPKPTPPSAKLPTSKPMAITRTTTVKSTTTVPKSTTTATKTTTASKSATPTTKTSPAPVGRSSGAKPSTPTSKPAARDPPLGAKVAPKTSAAPRTAAPAAAAPRPAAPAPSAARPAPRPPAARAPPRAAAPAAKPKPKPIEKPLTNGDVKDTKLPARVAPRAPPARPAARPAPPTKTTASNRPLDKQSKDLANKRITAKTAPPRTASAKPAAGPKGTAPKAVPKKPIIDSLKKEIKETLTNGEDVVKPPPSPPAADNALLPDVIA
ncbi:protein piccolo [Bombyx mori]|uniref:PPM-type phosphatase domain-containing protein n=1 Tax=Bombyx mori TaxID=7091 RepID=A0A8R2LXC6_BOMMO|nr:protein piccolo [Bombyx mori]